MAKVGGFFNLDNKGGTAVGNQESANPPPYPPPPPPLAYPYGGYPPPYHHPYPLGFAPQMPPQPTHAEGWTQKKVVNAVETAKAAMEVWEKKTPPPKTEEAAPKAIAPADPLPAAATEKCQQQPPTCQQQPPTCQEQPRPNQPPVAVAAGYPGLGYPPQHGGAGVGCHGGYPVQGYPPPQGGGVYGYYGYYGYPVAYNPYGYGGYGGYGHHGKFKQGLRGKYSHY